MIRHCQVCGRRLPILTHPMVKTCLDCIVGFAKKANLGVVPDHSCATLMVCDWCGCSLPGGGLCLDCLLGLNHNPAPHWGELLTKTMIMTVPGPVSFLHTSPRSRELGGPVLVPYLWHYARRFGLQ